LTVIGWRDTPVNGIAIGREARASQPYIEQLFLGKSENLELDEDSFERLLYRVRRRIENEIAASEIEGKDDFYIPSLSCRTINLQRPHAGSADREVLPRTRQSSGHQRPLFGPPALLDEHFSQLEACPPLPLCGT